jgi:hypothetical protein
MNKPVKNIRLDRNTRSAVLAVATARHKVHKQDRAFQIQFIMLLTLRLKEPAVQIKRMKYTMFGPLKVASFVWSFPRVYSVFTEVYLKHVYLLSSKTIPHFGRKNICINFNVDSKWQILPNSAAKFIHLDWRPPERIILKLILKKLGFLIWREQNLFR